MINEFVDWLNEQGLPMDAELYVALIVNGIMLRENYPDEAGWLTATLGFVNNEDDGTAELLAEKIKEIARR